MREQHSEQEEQNSQLQQQGLELRAEIDRHESQIQFNEDRMRDLQSQSARATSDISQAEERKLAAEGELEQVAQRWNGSSAAVEAHRQALEQKRQAFQGVETEMRTGQDSLRQAQNQSFEAAQQFSRARNEITALDLQKEGNAARLQKLSAEKIQLEEERTGLGARLQQFSESVEAGIQNAQTHRGNVEERQARLREVQRELVVSGQELDDLLRQQAEAGSRLSVLEQLQAEHEGFDAGTLTALKTAANVLGSLSDRIRVPDEHVAAIEAALGHRLQLVLTHEPEAARGILDNLRNNKSGRASVAALNLSAPPSAPDGNPPPGTPALSVVTAEAEAQPLLQRLLGRTFIAPDLAAATAAWRETNGAYDFVTSGGELLDRHGVFTGGYMNGHGTGKAASSILGRRNQIAELQTTTAALREEVAEVGRRKGAWSAEQTQLQAGLQEAQTELRTQEVAIATRQGEFNALQNSLRALEQKIETVVYEIKSLAAQEEEGAAKRQELATRAGALEVREREAQASLAELNATLEQLRQQRDAAQGTLTESKVALAAEEQVCASLAGQKRPLEARIAELSPSRRATSPGNRVVPFRV